MTYSAFADEVERRTGLRPSRSSFGRWCRSGLLRARRVGSRWITTLEAVAEFLANPSMPV